MASLIGFHRLEKLLHAHNITSICLPVPTMASGGCDHGNDADTGIGKNKLHSWVFVPTLSCK